MCGIAGLLPRKTLDDPKVLIRQMLQSLAHRGPDGQGIWVDQTHRIALGHCRLAVIDLTSGGHQPMVEGDGSSSIIFNGEIYNFHELRTELETQGTVFRSGSDTEVVLQGYQRWGEAVLDRLVGMFAFAIWDARKQRLFLARDRTGEKPLYYADTPQGLAFASELQALVNLPWVDRTIDQDALALYLQYQYVPAPYTIYTGIRKLPPAHAMLVEGESCTVYRYWDPSPLAQGPRLTLSEAEAEEQLDALLRQAVRGQMIADVPLGAFLSGGIDSTMVVSLMTELSERPVKTFTIGFEAAGYNEAEHAARVAAYFGTEHTVEYLTEQDALDLIPSLPAMYGEPFADSSALPTHLVSRVARKHVTVSLSGDGGDEVFGGYARYAHLERLAPWIRLGGPLAGLLGSQAHRLPGRLSRVVPLLGKPISSIYRGMVSVFHEHEVLRLAGTVPALTEFDRAWSSGSTQSWRRRAMLADLLTYLPEAILVKVDRAAMAIALETRAPLLDHRVIEFSLRLPDSMLQNKRLLKQLLYKKVPQQMLDRPKQGFAVPLDRWFRGELRGLLTDALSSDSLKRAGIQDTKMVHQYLAAHLSGEQNHSSRLWSLLMLSLWTQDRHG